MEKVIIMLIVVGVLTILWVIYQLEKELTELLLEQKASAEKQSLEAEGAMLELEKLIRELDDNEALLRIGNDGLDEIERRIRPRRSSDQPSDRHSS